MFRVALYGIVRSYEVRLEDSEEVSVMNHTNLPEEDLNTTVAQMFHHCD